MPSTPEEWRVIAAEFAERWNLPNCCGALDGKHIQIKSPGGSNYFNYLKYHSIVMLALVDAGYRFIFVDVGRNGRAGDAGIYRECRLSEGLENGTIGFPAPRPLPGHQVPMPHYIVGDDAFPLKTYLMKPYPFRQVVDFRDDEAVAERRKKRIFDYRVSRARRVSENAFGILASRFRIFQTSILVSPDKAKRITLAAIALHNFLASKRDHLFVPSFLHDREHPVTHALIPGEWRQERDLLDDLDRGVRANHPALDARAVREELNEWVNGVGQVPWQERQAFVDRQ
jgi:hypothetical protein